MADETKKPTIQPMKNGSFKVDNLTRLLNSKNEELPVKETLWLCRCGDSKNKPFCDGAHNETGFDDSKSDDRLEYRVRDYTGEKITIHDNRGLCSHSAECLKHLREVFDIGKRPWITADNAEPERIIETIKKCPSGALSYTYNNETVTDFNDEPMIKIDRHGPLNVTGGIEFIGEDGEQPENRDHYSLCRCGASKNKPFCDGTHLKIKFRDNDN